MENKSLNLKKGYYLGQFKISVLVFDEYDAGRLMMFAIQRVSESDGNFNSR